MSKKYLLLVVAIFVLTSALCVVGYGLWVKSDAPSLRYDKLAVRAQIEDSGDSLINFSPLRSALKQYLDSIKIEHSFYFEYLHTGTSIRSNENNQLVGASLLKLPTVVGLYKAVEKGQVDLDKMVTIKKTWLDNRFGYLWQQGEGKQFSLRELARLALVDSDNTAVNAIRGTLGKTISNNSVLAELDVNIVNIGDSSTKISSRDYSSVLKCLYLSCYLNQEHSQEILTMLSNSADYGRMASSLPGDVVVAHKIGVDANNVQSDCGIVYVSKRTYLLCMMLRQDSEGAATHMKIISRTVYDYVIKQSNL